MKTFMRSTFVCLALAIIASGIERGKPVLVPLPDCLPADKQHPCPRIRTSGTDGSISYRSIAGSSLVGSTWQCSERGQWKTVKGWTVTEIDACSIYPNDRSPKGDKKK
jgi:hypothetical protein